MVTEVFHKPSHEPYFLPFTSIHAHHIKKNIPFAALIRAIRYSSTYDAYKREESHICMSLLLNGYPFNFILKQLERVSQAFRYTTPKRENYSSIRKVILAAEENRKQAKINFEVNLICHFSFCKGMHDFPTRFHKLWDECFFDTAISKMEPIVGFKRLNNLQEYLVRKKPSNSLLRSMNDQA